MSFRTFVAKFFSNHAETSDHHPDSTLQTRYYKTTKDRAFSVLESMFKAKKNVKINSVSVEHGEISIYMKQGKKAFVIITVIMVRPYQTAIDFSVTTESILPVDFGFSTRLIQKLYQEINKELPLID
ncbi:cytosolic protein [Virgibacillus soli]|uniref:Cytosolic protein n=1 Tax=Paracerasibacillus soli TaxID=480284 RepID=A0ABU5CRY8_9BACI|nr:cytosolic protein [Virgibacillus soli]MDY0408641.1 cytosolic protein [Virgibacillus soli]